MENRSQLPVEEIGTQTGKIRFINEVNYCCIAFKIAVKVGFFDGKLSLTVIIFSLYDNLRPISGV